MQWARHSARRILAATADEATREAMVELLTGHGYLVSTATDTHAAQSVIAAFRPHLVFVDLDLAGGGAVEVIEFAARMAPGTRVGLLTNHLDLDAQRLAEDLGAATHINRPLDLSRLLRVTGFLAATAPVL